MKLHASCHMPLPSRTAPRFSGTVQANPEFLSHLPENGLAPLEALVKDYPIYVNLSDGLSSGGFVALVSSPVGEARHTDEDSASTLMKQCSESIRSLISRLPEEQAKTDRARERLTLQTQIKSLLQMLACHEEIKPEELTDLDQLDTPALQLKSFELQRRMAPYNAERKAQQQAEQAARRVEAEAARQAEQQARQEKLRAKMIQQIAVFETFLRESSSGKLVERPEITDAISDEQIKYIHATLRAEVMQQCPQKRTVKGTQKAKEAFEAKFMHRYGFKPSELKD